MLTCPQPYRLFNFLKSDGRPYFRCYTGQEVVTRTRHLGKIKRRMYLAHTDGDTQPALGDKLFSNASESGQGAGKVVDAQASPGGGCEILAVLATAVETFTSEV